ncbi:MAG: FeoB-associated Cys-rich membrane protein, partial [Atopobium sp.]|nr:FeoB-associated Cys-rich membrane protein [Atopobium sp.]
QLKSAKEGSCSGCSSSSSCGTHHGGDGHCGVAQKMISDVDKAFDAQ